MPIPATPALLALVAALPPTSPAPSSILQGSSPQVPIHEGPIPEGPDDGWTSLDAEVEALTATMTQSADGPRVWGWLRFFYADSDDFAPPGGANDFGGFVLDSVRVNLEGFATEGVEYRVDTDLFNGSLTLIQAYADVKATEGICVRVGQFRVPFLRSGLIEPDRRLFIAPTRNGLFYATADLSRQGVMIYGGTDEVLGELAIQNGLDIQGDELMISGRVTWDVVGSGTGMVEGAWGAPEGTHASLGAAFSDDQSASDGLALAVEGSVTHDRLSLHAELIDYEEDYSIADALMVPPIEPRARRGDTTPYSVTASWVVDEEQENEVAVRYEDFDDRLDRELTSVGWNRYFHGHGLKLQLNYTYLGREGGDEAIVAAGLSLSF